MFQLNGKQWNGGEENRLGFIKQITGVITLQNSLFIINFILDFTFQIQHLLCNIFPQFNGN